MDRRSFLNSLGFGTVAAAASAIGVVDIERLLWTPGERTIFIPKPREVLNVVSTFGMNVGDTFTIQGCYNIDPKTHKRVPQVFVVTAQRGPSLAVKLAHGSTWTR